MIIEFMRLSTDWEYFILIGFNPTNIWIAGMTLSLDL